MNFKLIEVLHADILRTPLERSSITLNITAFSTALIY